MKKNKKKIFVISLCIVMLLLTIYICYKLIPLLISLKDADNQQRFKEYIKNMGFKGWLALLTIQVLQIFIAFIPGEVVELLAGVLYGAWGGLLLCLLGISIASILIYYTVKLFANKYMIKYKEKLKTYSFLNDPKQIHLYFFILFLIPGIPKDIFIYLAPFLPIKFSTFIVVSLIARIPSIISSTIVGDSFMKGNYVLSIVIFVVFAIFGTLGILFNDKIINLLKHNKNTNNEDNIEN